MHDPLEPNGRGGGTHFVLCDERFSHGLCEKANATCLLTPHPTAHTQSMPFSYVPRITLRSPHRHSCRRQQPATENETGKRAETHPPHPPAQKANQPLYQPQHARTANASLNSNVWGGGGACRVFRRNNVTTAANRGPCVPCVSKSLRTAGSIILLYLWYYKVVIQTIALL